MGSKVKAIPEGYKAATPYLFVKDAEKALEFYKHAFNATELVCMKNPNGQICHAEIKIGHSPVMLADECPEMDMVSPLTLGGSPVTLHIYVEDVDSFIKTAVEAGASSLTPIKNQFYGDRTGSIRDPFGHVWHIATHKEDISLEELNKRFEEFKKNVGKAK